MKQNKPLLLITIAFFISFGCEDLRCNDVACYPGAPDVSISFKTNENLDSAYLDYQNWIFYHEGSILKTYNTSDKLQAEYPNLYMMWYEEDQKFIFEGNGLIWEHLDDLKANVLIDYGNSDIDTLTVTIGEGYENCCSFNFIEGVTFNGQQVKRDSWRFEVDLIKE